MQIARLADIRVHYDDRGPKGGPTVLFANSLGTDFRLWDRVVARLPDHLRLIRYDKRGHGLTTAPDGPYFMGDLVQDAGRLLDHLEVDAAHLVAQSMGGRTMLGVALVLTSAVMRALAQIQIRRMVAVEETSAIVFYFSLFSVPVLALAMPFVGKAHAPDEWLLLLACGVIGLLGQVLLTAALRYGAVANVIVMDYSGLVWATLFGWLVFDNLPPSSTWLGAPMVIGAGLLIAWRERQLGLARRALEEPK